MMKAENNNKKEKEKSSFTLAEELRQKLLKQRQERDNALTADRGSSSWIARRLIQNAVMGKTGNFSEQ
jgi:hypothetical protein